MTPRLNARNVVVLIGLAICCIALWMVAGALAKAGVTP